MRYTQRQWDREVGWGKVPEEYKYKNKLEEYKSKINYDVWNDISQMSYNVKEVKVTYNMKEVNNELQSRSSKTTRTNNRNDKS